MVGALATLLGGESRSIENPAVPLGDIDWDHPYASSVMGGTQSSAGVVVNSETALTASAVWRGVNLLSGVVGKLPMVGYERLDPGKRRAPELPAYRLLRRKPNEFTNALHFKQVLTAHALLTGRGNGYAFINRKQSGEPLELLILDPLVTYPVRANGVLWYVTTVGTEPIRMPAEDVLHIRGLGFDGLVGYDVLQICKEALGGAVGTKRYSNTYFKNSARPSVVLEHPEKLSEAAQIKLRTDWERMHQGIDNAHRTVVLYEGMKASVLADNIRQSILIEAQQFDIIQISNVLGVPPHKLGHEARTSYNSLAEENQSFLDDGVDYWLNVWEAECNDKLLTEVQKEADSHYFEFVREALVRADLETRYAAYNTGLRAGWINVDEVRDKENLNPLPNGEGQVFFRPKELAVIGEEETPPELEPEMDNNEEAQRQSVLAAHRALAVDAVGRMHRRVCSQAQRAARKPDRFIDWLDEMDGANRDAFIKAVGPVVRAARNLRSWSDAHCDAMELADCYFIWARDSLLTVAECQPAELASAVAAWATGTDAGPEAIADRVVRRTYSEVQ